MQETWQNFMKIALGCQMIGKMRQQWIVSTTTLDWQFFKRWDVIEMRLKLPFLLLTRQEGFISYMENKLLKNLLCYLIV